MMDWTTKDYRFARLFNPNVVLYTEMVTRARSFVVAPTAIWTSTSEEHPIVLQLVAPNPQELADPVLKNGWKMGGYSNE